ncbi:ornithine carbamoyltransferase [Candidatus Microgenomates bacterium]|nr:ornithine carbamoyltransferase [Candidatus Microgenomates bacterium]
MKKKRDLLSLTDLAPKEIWDIFALAKRLKKELKNKGGNKPLLKGKSLALIFEKQSLRTRISFEIGMFQLGGYTVYLDPRDTGIGVRESEADIAKVLSGMADIIAARTYSHQTIVNIAKNSTIPVINALSDLEHPCQALTDLFTIWSCKAGSRSAGEMRLLKGLTIAYVGDGENNVAHSLCLGAAMMGMTFRSASPKGFWMNKNIAKTALSEVEGQAEILETENPEEAVKGADVVYTDTWISMGDEQEKEKRLTIFKPYQVNQKLMKLAKKDAIFMHDLPAYRGNEVAADVIDGPQSVVFQQAENRLHVQKALLVKLPTLPK